MADFGTLKSSITRKLSDGDLVDPTQTEIGTAINSTINFYRKKRFWFNEQIFTTILNVDDPIVPNIPSDFGQIIIPNGLSILDSNIFYPLVKITPLEYDSINVFGQGLPRFYTFRDNQFELYNFPDKAYQIKLYYYKKYVDLTNNTDTNDFTDNADRLVEAKSLADLFRDFREGFERTQIYENLARDEFNNLMDETYERSARGELATENIIDNRQQVYLGYF